ncbi:CotH kinase family protein [Enhygromyxa salina]|uniref:CotH protein n=1 Tax=Enhygromyxa salina TaxID=215803 RepID=A0A2S9YNF5_9BACT|nr:CotH kinase family protein [Enhygromyxa salina]PRQ06618.1 CotH protein [Enhygromyxa salina]
MIAPVHRLCHALLVGLALAVMGCEPPNAEPEPEPEPELPEVCDVQADGAGLDVDCSLIAQVVPTGTELYDDHGLRRHVRIEDQAGQVLGAEYGACLVVTDADCEVLATTIEPAASRSITALLVLPVAEPGQAVELQQAVMALIEARPADERIALFRWGQRVTQISTPTTDRARLAQLLGSGLGLRDDDSLAPAAAVDVIDDTLALVQGDHGSVRQLLVVGPDAIVADAAPVASESLRVDFVSLGESPSSFAPALLDASTRLDAALAAGEQVVSYCALDLAEGARLQVVGGGPSLELDHVAVPGAEPGMSCEAGVGAPAYPEVIEILLSPSQRIEYDSRVAELSKEPFVGKIRTDLNAPDLTAPAKLKLRGNNSLACERKSYSLNFEDDQPRRWFEDSATDEFFLLSMCLDDRYITQFTANQLMAELGLFAPKFRMVEVVLSGVSQGVYLLVEKPHEELRHDNTGVRLIMRRASDVEGEPPELKHSAGSEAQAEADYEAFLTEAETRTGDDLLAWLEASMDLEQYLRWIALMSLLESGDYVDEVYFMSTDVTAEPGVTRDFFSISTWDQDDIFSPCHNNGDFAIQDPHELLYCTEGRLDYAIFEDPGVYARYVDTLEQTLAWLEQGRFDAATDISASAVLAQLGGEQARAAMIELLSVNPDAVGFGVLEDEVQTRAGVLREAFAARRALVAERIAAYRVGN